MFGDFDLAGLMQQAQQMQEDLERAQEDLARQSFTAQAGGDLVTVTLSGKGDLTDVVIKPEACDPEDPETLSALIVAAFRAAKGQADAAVAAAMPQLPQLPGLGG
ncbi:MAG: YbaB/EbfC family nucleoid-associated protein [Arachnia sp.]